VRAPGSARFAAFSIAGLTSPATVVSIAEDRHGGIWAALREGAVVHCTTEACSLDPRWTIGPAMAVFVDRQGRLWTGSRSGTLICDDPLSPSSTPRTAEGPMGADAVSDFVEDRDGRLYAATLNGVLLYEPRSGLTHRYSVRDGLPSSLVQSATRDALGDLWFATFRGLARLRPGPLPPVAPNAPRIAAVTIGDTRHRISEFGAVSVTGLDVAPGQYRMRVDYFALATAAAPLFQHRLSSREPWSEPSSQGTTELAGLSAGRYRFEVRSIAYPGGPTSSSAFVDFTVQPPAWARWWFLSSAALLVAGAGYGLHRYRLAHALRLQRLRAEIATDLHDDIGSSLSQIAVLAEVSRQRLPSAAAEPIGTIAEVSRELIDKMADIVWAVNPKRDTLADLVSRMRRFAGETLAARNVQLTFLAPESMDGQRLDPRMRRELLLVLKESVTNIARHSGCSEARIALSLHGHHLRMEVQDNGCGFDLHHRPSGNGLSNIEARVRQLQGRLRVDSTPGQGTRLALDIRV
jgi:signal transduction histidine kinase